MSKQQNSKTNFYLSGICIFLFFLYLFSYTPFFQNKHAEKKRESALLNVKYEKLVTSINLHKAGKTIILSKQGTLWSGSCIINGLVRLHFPVNESVVNLFLTKMTQTRKLFIVSSNSNDWDKFDLGEQSPYLCVTVAGEDDSIYTKLYFSNKKTPANRLSLRSDKTLTIYQINDDISYYLKADAETWCDPYLIPQTVFGPITEDDIQRIVFIRSSDNRSYSSRTVAEQLLKLRHGKLNYQLKLPETAPSGMLHIETGTGAIISISFYLQQTNADDKTYIVAYSFDPGTAESFIPSNFSTYRVLLSDWTYNKIVNLFTKNTEEKA